jgi:hypothetical protein
MNIISDFYKPVFAKEKNGKVSTVKRIDFYIDKIFLAEPNEYMPIKDVEMFQHFVGNQTFDLDKPIFVKQKNGECGRVQSINFELKSFTIPETSGQDESLFRWLKMKDVEVLPQK